MDWRTKNDVIWESYFKLPVLLVSVVESISKLCKDSSKDEWIDCLIKLNNENYTRYLCNDDEDSNGLFPNKRWTFQHHAAYHSAPEDVIKMMVKMGFPMSYKDGDKKLPLDYVAAEMKNYKRLFKYRLMFENLDISKVNNIEQQFHNLINSKVHEWVKKHNLILPVLSVVLEHSNDKPLSTVYCAILGMCGGFNFRFEFNNSKSDVESLITVRLCRISGGSELHKCTEDGFILLDKLPGY